MKWDEIAKAAESSKKNAKALDMTVQEYLLLMSCLYFDKIDKTLTILAEEMLEENE